MTRNKYPEVTVNRILDAATKLFMAKGYEKTTIQDIVEELGDLSKGAIYHHFKSKEEIIDAVSDREFYNNNWFEKIRESRELNGREKISTAIVRILEGDPHRKLIAGVSVLLQNPKYVVEELKSAVYGVAPYLETLISEGAADGSLSTEDPQKAAQVIMLLINIWSNPMVFAADREEFMERIRFLGVTFEQMGLPIINEAVSEAASSYYDEVFQGQKGMEP